MNQSQDIVAASSGHRNFLKTKRTWSKILYKPYLASLSNFNINYDLYTDLWQCTTIG